MYRQLNGMAILSKNVAFFNYVFETGSDVPEIRHVDRGKDISFTIPSAPFTTGAELLPTT